MKWAFFADKKYRWAQFLPISSVFFVFAGCTRVAPDCKVIASKDGTTYVGTVDSTGLRSGYGVLTRGDSTLYAGQWQADKRCGVGRVTDSTGTIIIGTWRADTLVTASRTDSLGTYRGEFNRHLVAEGHGTYLDTANCYYNGHWSAGQRMGWGFAITPGKRLRAGEWKADRYLGERLNYTADRIYGIDISRFQHEKGRTRFNISWNRLRITALGTISKKTVSGTVDYPVSFCYIKSTEGRSLHNQYFNLDYKSARQYGIVCGAYHFWSHTSTATAQAENFLRNTRFSKGDLPPVLDLEPTAAQIQKMGGVAAMFSGVRKWMSMVERRTGTRPVLYVSQTFVNKYLPSAPDIKQKYNIWIARYGEYKPDVRLVYWQLCPDGRVQGIIPKVDINVFNGYRAEFEEFLSKNCVK